MIFAVFAQLVATCYIQATWIDLSRTFYFEKMVGVVFWALLLGLFSYALLRGIADSLTGRMADPSLYGARVREALRAWRELPRYRIVQRADLMAQLLYLVLTVLCIFYLVFISIDWYDGVIRLGETWYPPDRHRWPLPRLPDLEFRHPEHRADGLEDVDHPALGPDVAGRQVGQGAVVRPPAGLRRQPRLRAHGPFVQPGQAGPAGNRAGRSC